MHMLTGDSVRCARSAKCALDAEQQVPTFTDEIVAHKTEVNLMIRALDRGCSLASGSLIPFRTTLTFSGSIP